MLNFIQKIQTKKYFQTYVFPFRTQIYVLLHHHVHHIYSDNRALLNRFIYVRIWILSEHELIHMQTLSLELYNIKYEFIMLLRFFSGSVAEKMREKYIRDRTLLFKKCIKSCNNNIMKKAVATCWIGWTCSSSSVLYVCTVKKNFLSNLESSMHIYRTLQSKM